MHQRYSLFSAMKTVVSALVVAALIALVSAEIPRRCKLPKDTGRCAGEMRRWYHDTKEKKCRPFRYTGCRGNANRFETKDECEKTCKDAEVEKPGTCPREPPDPCGRECKVDTDCRPNQKCCHSNKCGKTCRRAEFPSPGCAATLCPICTKCVEDAEGNAKCLVVEDCPQRCRLPLAVGSCEASIPSWWFNSQSQRCERFRYGGCQGNANRFSSRDECRDACNRRICPVPAFSPTPGCQLKSRRVPGACDIYYAECQCSRDSCGRGERCVSMWRSCRDANLAKPCLQYHCESNCPTVPRRSPRPPQGCRWERTTDIRGCPVETLICICSDGSCQRGDRCVPLPNKICRPGTSPCNKFRCEPRCPSPPLPPPPHGCRYDRTPDRNGCPTNNLVCDCTNNDCRRDEICIPMPVTCVRAPCKQYRCEKKQRNPCDPNPCRRGEQCVDLTGRPCFGRPCRSFQCQRPKRGRCPAPRNLLATCVNACAADNDCGGIEKCCSNGCGNVCSLPFSPADRQSCRRDRQCPGKCGRCVRGRCVEPLIRCFGDPCSGKRCPRRPRAKCQREECGCGHQWIMPNGRDVTRRCFRGFRG